jgi:hypothetical protein
VQHGGGLAGLTTNLPAPHPLLVHFHLQMLLPLLLLLLLVLCQQVPGGQCGQQPGQPPA